MSVTQKPLYDFHLVDIIKVFILFKKTILSATIIANTMYFVNVKNYRGKALNSLASSPFLLILYSVSIIL